MAGRQDFCRTQRAFRSEVVARAGRPFHGSNISWERAARAIWFAAHPENLAKVRAERERRAAASNVTSELVGQIGHDAEAFAAFWRGSLNHLSPRVAPAVRAVRFLVSPAAHPLHRETIILETNFKSVFTYRSRLAIAAPHPRSRCGWIRPAQSWFAL